MSYWHWAFVPLLLLALYGFTRIPLWLTRSWVAGGLLRFALAHLFCLLLIAVAGAHVYGKPPLLIAATAGPPLFLIFLIDWLRYARQRKAGPPPRVPVMRDMNRRRRA